MPTHELSRSPLNADEQELLLLVYSERLSKLRRAYFGFMVLSFLLTALWFTMSTLQAVDPTSAVPLNLGGRILKYVGIFIIVQLLFVLPASNTFFKKIYPLRKDLQSGEKEEVPYTIIKKEYFPLTGKFFVSTEDPQYLHHEVDEDFFRNCNEGDIFYMYRGISSKFVFEKDGRYTV